MPREGILAPNPSRGWLDLQPGFPEVLWLYLQLGWVYWVLALMMDFPGDASGKEPACQCRRHETQVLFVGREDPVEKGMATYSSILAWRIPWTEEPDRL